MIAHLVLYQVRDDLTVDERAHFTSALETALHSIPCIRRTVIGRRKAMGVSYEKAMVSTYEYVAILEFDDEAGLREYLEHPAHAELGALFWSCSSRVLVFDYETVEGRDLQNALTGWF